nr:reverse transcriptase domain-containing protein [Tanacetum cinerariifolium]
MEFLRETTKEETNSSKELAMVKTHLQLIKHQLTKLQMNTASSSGSRTLPSNTISNPKEELKGITTRCGTAYQGSTIPTTYSLPQVVERETKVTKDTVPPTNNGSTKDVQPPVVQTESPILNSEPIVAPIIEPVVAPISAPKPNQKPLIPYPSRLHDQKLRDKANDQKEKFFKIFQHLNFNISFADALILMPKFGPSIKSLLTNKDKLYELARTLLNEHCSTVLLKKLPEKLGDPDKFLFPCDFPGIAECLALADLGASINLMPLSVWNKISLHELSPSYEDEYRFMMNTASSSGSRTLPSNTISNPKEELKGITTRCGTAYQGSTIPTTYSLPQVVERETEVTKDTVPPTNNGSTKDVQPPIVQTESPILNSEPIVAPIIEPVVAPISAPKPNQKPLIPYPSRLKLRDKANDQKEKFFKIFQHLNFNISFADAL